MDLRELRENLRSSYGDEIAKLQQQLDAFDKLGLRTGERHNAGGPWIDTTERDKQRVLASMAEYQKLLSDI